ncbi:MAG: vitamin K epoxide reductase family protein [Chloroflexota bacterium]
MDTTIDIVPEESSGIFTMKNLALLFVVAGLVISGYLSYAKLFSVQTVCTQGEQFSCSLVQNSLYSELYGIPIAYLGFGLYCLIGLTLILENRVGFLVDYGRLLLFLMGIVGWVFSMWLVYVQGAILGAWCQWCLAHEFNFTLLFGTILYLLWHDWR